MIFIHFIFLPLYFVFFFFNDPAPTEIYTLSLHDALPILIAPAARVVAPFLEPLAVACVVRAPLDRKSTRLNSSHRCISYAVFCLKKKKRIYKQHHEYIK